MATVFGIDALAADIGEDFAEHSIVAAIEIGEWETFKNHGAPLVVIGRGRGRIEDPTGDHYAANASIDLGDGTVARALLHRMTLFKVWVYAAAPAGTAPANNAIAAREATDALLDATLAAIRRTRGGMVSGWSDVELLAEERGDFVYGSAVSFGVEIAVPVYDDPLPTAQIGEVEADHQITIDGVDIPDPPETTDST